MSRSATSGTADAPAGDARELGRTYSEWFDAGELERLWEQLAPELRDTFHGVGGFREFREKVGAWGSEQAVLSECVTSWLGSRVYSRTAEYSHAAAPILQQWVFDAEGTAVGFLVEPGSEPAPSRFLDYRTRTPLRLPFHGDWFVFWGGRHPVENRHATTADQRFGYDFLVVRGAHTHSTDPPVVNEKFYCFGEPILAPGDGRVVARVSGIHDNAPGSLNTDDPLGNHLVIDHGHDEFSVLGHLQRDSLRVKVGDRVRAGHPIARCGNSGASTEPHLQYHLQNCAEIGAGEGLPAQFLGYRADGVPVEHGEPRRGQFVRGA